jgi:hypothetical protein
LASPVQGVGSAATGWVFCRSCASDTRVIVEKDNRVTAVETSDKMPIEVFICGVFAFGRLGLLLVCGEPQFDQEISQVLFGGDV